LFSLGSFALPANKGMAPKIRLLTLPQKCETAKILAPLRELKIEPGKIAFDTFNQGDFHLVMTIQNWTILK